MLINGGQGETFNGIVTFFWRSYPYTLLEFIQHSYAIGGKVLRLTERQIRLMIRGGGTAQFAD